MWAFVAQRYTGEGLDPSRPSKITAVYLRATREQIKTASDDTVRARGAWPTTSDTEPTKLLECCTEASTQSRSEVTGAGPLEASKAATEADTGISEAMDFGHCCARRRDDLVSEFADRTVSHGSSRLPFPWWRACGANSEDTVILKAAIQFVPTTNDTGGQSVVADDHIGVVIMTSACATGRLFRW